MTTNDSWRRYLEAGAAVGQLTLARADEIARGLLADDEEERATAWNEFEELTRFGHQMGEQLVEVARAELTKKLETLGVSSLDQLLERIAELVGNGPVHAPSDRSEAAAESVSAERREPAPRTATDAAGAEPAAKGGTASGARGEKRQPKKKDSRDKTDKTDKRDKKKDKKAAPEAKSEKKQKNEKEKVSGDPHWAPTPHRVLTLARPPDSAGSS